ncbi:MAG: hypothetical protein ACFFG0_37280, partial [Candidatus Thorarchaeota archaeon]
LPGYKPKWNARKGAKQLYEAYKDVGVKLDDFEGPRYRRILHVKELIESGIIFSVGIERALYQYIQRVATKLGYMNIAPMDLGRAYVIRNEDYLKVVDKIWEYITAVILAPGKNWENTWFPNLHLTQKGKEFMEK